MTDKEIIAIHKRDQAWANMQAYQTDLERINNGGIKTPEDFRIVQKACFLVSGELKYRQRTQEP
jgi:hypothetical protein